MKNIILAFIIVILIGLLGYAGFRWYQTLSRDLSDGSADEILESAGSVEANIVLEEPQEGAVVSSPLTIKGEARVFENVVEWRLLKKDGEVLASGYTTANSPDVGVFGLFEDRIFLPLMDDDEFTLEVYWSSPKDGARTDVISRNLKLADSGKTTVQIYFTDPAAAEFGDCSAVDFEKRTVTKTVNVAELALLELLKGPTSEWASTEIPEYTTLGSIDIAGGVATVDFIALDEAEWVGGSCYVSAIRTQIEQTLLQFDTVDSVVILVNGKSEGILEP